MTKGQSVPSTEISPGRFSLVFEDVRDADDEPFPYEITFDWSGENTASFVFDACPDPSDPTFVGEINSDPVYGWASWLNEEDVLIAFMHPMAEKEGWARVGAQAPGAGLDDPEGAMSHPQTWITLAKLIYAVTADKPLPDCNRQTY